MSKLINWFRSFSKEKNLKEKLHRKIETYRKQMVEVNKRRNKLLANDVPETQLLYLDAPEKMLIFTNSEPILSKSEFIIALSYFVDDIDRSQIIDIDELAWQYDIFRCTKGCKEIYCDTSKCQ